MTQPKVSIVSVAYRSLADTRAFIESVRAYTNDPYEFVFCANGATDPEVQDYLSREDELGHLKLLWNPRNIGVRAFGQVMRLASTDYVFRCDSDIVIDGDPYWTRRMVDQLHASKKDIGDVVAVGTANTRGHRIRRTPQTVETDMIMSNCMLIHKPTARLIGKKLRAEYPRLSADAERLTHAGPPSYPGFHGDLEATLEYARLGGWWWDTNFGGKEEPIGYGSDDMWWSIMARWAGLKLVTSNAGVVHKDASARPGYEAERHRLVARGFQYMRTSLSLMMGVWEQEHWNELPNNLPVLVEYRKSGEAIAA